MQLSREALKEANPLRIHLNDGEARREPMEVSAWVLRKEKFLFIKTFLFLTTTCLNQFLQNSSIVIVFFPRCLP